jgi:2-polyprenyl-3-methyl-5-hydroxy-6-metoxy-1,4-benzoquinol methylase
LLIRQGPFRATAPGYPFVYKRKESIMAKHVCPVWVGHFLASPLRKLLNNPKSMLGKHVIKDMIVLDIGCAMGFFSLPLAEMVGAKGKVICIDLQEKRM